TGGAIRIETDERRATRLSGPVIGDAAAATGLVDRNAARGEHFRARDDMRTPAVAANADRDHVWMFHQEERVADAAGPPLFDERALHLERLVVADQAKPPHI